jgi:serine/threonine protein kinase
MLRLLGVGGHGEVWLAEDLVSGDQVAVKVRRDQAASLPASRGEGSRGEGSGGEGSRGEGSRGEGSGGEGPRGVGPGDDSADSAQQAAARLNREVALLRRIDHPHVVRLRRVVDLPGGARALVMDHAAGGSLADLVAIRGPLEATEAATLSVPLARTLADLHERGLVHGDLTPSNVLFTADGRPMIADLGCAVVLGDATAEAWGSPGYCDPARAGRAGPSDDVYSLGAVLRFALTGRPGAEADLLGAGGNPSAGPSRGEVRALLAVADLCTAPEPDRRPGPGAVAATVLATVTPAPIRLIGLLPPPVLADRGRRAPGRAEPVQVAPAEVTPVRSNPVRSNPVRIRFAAATPTAPTSLPVTVTDLPVQPGTTRQVAGRPTTTGGRSSPKTGRPTAKEDRLTPKVGRSAPKVGRAAPAERAAQVGTPSGRRRREPRGRASGSQRRGRLVAGGLGWAVAVACGLAVAIVAGRWFAATGASPGTSSSAAGGAGGAAGGTGGAAGGALAAPVMVDATVARLAEGRAAAFRRASSGPLTAVDEPGSPALEADLAFVRRLRAAGVQLAGLTFTVTGVRVGTRGPDGSLLVTARVITSAHVRQPLAGGAAAAASSGPVPESAPREVTLTLVPARGGRSWLVRSVR